MCGGAKSKYLEKGVKSRFGDVAEVPLRNHAIRCPQTTIKPALENRVTDHAGLHAWIGRRIVHRSMQALCSGRQGDSSGQETCL